MKILLATGQEAIHKEILKHSRYEAVATVQKREDLLSLIKKTHPDIVLTGEGLPGSGMLPGLLLDAAGRHPNTRFIYLAGETPMSDVQRIEPIRMLARAGIYDIVHSGKIKRKELMELVNAPRTRESIAHLLEDDEPEGREPEIEKPVIEKPVIEKPAIESPKIEEIEPEKPEARVEEPPKAAKQTSEVQVEYTPDPIRAPERSEDSNVIVVSSIKPGTGKSFLAVNIATAIAQYGVNLADGTRPRVALIEADLQNLSVGTLLQIDDKESHLMKAIELIQTVLTPSGDLAATPEQLLDVNRDLRKCFSPYYRVKNLEVLAGSHLGYGEMQKVTGYNYSYLIEAMKPYYDVIIVDANSSMAHTTTFPILRQARSCYFILNLDFNNIRNNLRYQQELERMGIFNKVRYILNEDLGETLDGEKLDFTKNSLEELGFKLEASIPFIHKSIFLNRLYQGTPIVLDKEKETEEARHQLFKIANQVHPIMNFSEKNGDELRKKKRLSFRK